MEEVENGQLLEEKMKLVVVENVLAVGMGILVMVDVMLSVEVVES